MCKQPAARPAHALLMAKAIASVVRLAVMGVLRAATDSAANGRLLTAVVVVVLLVLNPNACIPQQKRRAAPAPRAATRIQLLFCWCSFGVSTVSTAAAVVALVLVLAVVVEVCCNRCRLWC